MIWNTFVNGHMIWYDNSWVYNRTTGYHDLTGYYYVDTLENRFVTLPEAETFARINKEA